jgi:hypothetical protein
MFEDEANPTEENGVVKTNKVALNRYVKGDEVATSNATLKQENTL